MPDCDFFLAFVDLGSSLVVCVGGLWVRLPHLSLVSFSCVWNTIIITLNTFHFQSALSISTVHDDGEFMATKDPSITTTTTTTTTTISIITNLFI